MEIFYSNKIANGIATLSAEESAHCIRVLRHKIGDKIRVSNGDGNLYDCILLEDSPKEVKLEVLSVVENFGTHPYYLEMAVAPTKSIDRFEWFLEKATEIGVDHIVPLLCSHSERKVLRKDRAEKVVLSAAKQSLKGTLPKVEELTSCNRFIEQRKESNVLKLIAFCDSDIERITITQAINKLPQHENKACVLIGPEGDFSREEIKSAIEAGFIPISLGESRLRTETAAVLAVTSFYLYL